MHTSDAPYTRPRPIAMIPYAKHIIPVKYFRNFIVMPVTGPAEGRGYARGMGTTVWAMLGGRFYCALILDGWVRIDDHMDEHGFVRMVRRSKCR